MAIVKMERLRLMGMGADREQILTLLQHLGCVEIGEASVEGEANAPPEQQELLARLRERLSHPDPAELNAARERRMEGERALEVLKRFAPEKTGLLSPKPTLTEAELFREPEAQAALAAAQEINQADRRLHAIQAEQAKLAAQRAALAPWLNLDLPLETESTGQVAVQMGTLPAAVPLARAEGVVQAAGELAQLTCVSADREQQYLLLMCHNSQWEKVMEALKELGWSRASLREWTGTAAENTERLAREQERLAREQAELEQKLAGMGACRPELRKLADRSQAEVSRGEGRSLLLDTEQTFFLEGWVPAERWPELEQALSPFSCAWEVSDPAEEDYPQVPVALKNNWLTRPLNMVTEMYSLPAYGSLDPNPLMAPFFILFYGIMMADMGYGLLMMLASVVVLTKKKPTGTMRHFFGLLGLCGVSTFVMGGVTGGFLGDFIPQLLKVINPESTFVWFWTPLFTPLDDTLMILVGAMCLGFIQIITGMVISVVKKLRRGQVMDAIWEEVTWWVVFAGIALAILGVTNWVLIAGGVMVLVGSGWNAKGFGKITAVFGSLYNHITGYFGDILSYSRLMALMLAGSVIAQVFNTLGAIPGNVVFFIVVSLAGNTLNFALNLLGCYVHDLRLQCLEYFKTFYEDGGRPFRPLELKTKYYQIVKE